MELLPLLFEQRPSLILELTSRDSAFQAVPPDSFSYHHLQRLLTHFLAHQGGAYSDRCQRGVARHLLRLPNVLAALAADASSVDRLVRFVAERVEEAKRRFVAE